jgi:hypothetical protein
LPPLSRLRVLKEFSLLFSPVTKKGKQDTAEGFNRFNGVIWISGVTLERSKSVPYDLRTTSTKGTHEENRLCLLCFLVAVES